MLLDRSLSCQTAAEPATAALTGTNLQLNARTIFHPHHHILLTPSHLHRLRTMLVVGLTGGIASGKSTASFLISSHPSRIPIIDLDILAREVVAPGQPALSSLRATFGPTVINTDGTLNAPSWAGWRLLRPKRPSC